ncbi:MAG: hypothetical protein ACT4PM_03955 [Gemmatimonadales bacterium]
MMTSPFDNQPDEVLGRMLREQLTGPRPEVFLARLRQAVAAAGPGSQWDVLAAWSRPRVMAAAIAAALLLWLGSWLATGSARQETAELVPSLPAQAVLSAQSPPVDEIMSALMERR